MAFLVFPDPPASPVSLLAGAASASVTIGEPAAPDPVTGVEAMYITIVQLGGAGSCAAPADPTSPTVVLHVAGSAEVPVTGPMPLVEGTDGPSATIFAAGKQMTARMRALANGVFRIRIAFPNGVTGESWQMKLRNNDRLGRELRYTWVVAGIFDESLQPWIEVPAAPATGPLEVLINRFEDFTIPVQNLGTGPLTIVDTPIGGGFAIKTMPPPIPPNACATMVLTYTAATSPEEVAIAHDVESNDTAALAAAGHNRQLALAAKSIMFEIGFVLDASGSMASRPNGTPTGVVDEQRWGKLRTAAGIFLDSLKNFGTDAGTFGVAVFPDVTAGAPPSSATEVFGLSVIDASSTGNAKEMLLSLAPDGGTPMGDGIEVALGGSGFSGFFAGGASERAVDRRWIVLMSDGAHNQGPPQPEAFTGAGPQSFVGKRVKAFTVAYGEPGTWEVRPEQLNLIASASGGVAQDAGVDDAGLDLVKAFELALTTGLNLPSSADPRHLLTPNAPLHRHTVLVTPFDTKVSFVIAWGTIDREQWPRVWLLTPNGEFLDWDTAAGELGVTVDAGERYIMFTVDESYLQGGVPRRYGPWQLFVANENLPFTGGEEPYSFNVIVDSRLKLDVTFDQARYAAGDSIGIAAALTIAGAPISDARVLLHLTAPRQSAANWLAAQPVSPKEVEKAAAFLMEISRADRATLLRAKALAVAGFEFENMAFDPLNQTDAVPMTYDGQRGRYTAQTRATSVPGTYDFFISVLGAASDGTPYRREARVQQRLDVRPAPYPAVSILDVVFLPTNEIEATLRIWPRDRFGNVVMVDTEYQVVVDPEGFKEGTDQTIKVEVDGAEKDGSLVTNLDGSYSQKVRYLRDLSSSPLVNVLVYEEPVVEKLSLPTMVTHRFADAVFDWVEGAEAKEGMNVYDNPDAAAHADFPFDGERFVALGGQGELTLGIGGAVIKAGSPDDVVVFVHPTAELRPYVVEAWRMDGIDEWVRIGYSPGTTQGFTMTGVLDVTEAIRIRDVSGRTYDDELNPLDAPGVNILGVGFRSVS